MPLRTADENLRDLADGSPALVDADTGEPTGARLVRWLGAGGMSAAFLAEIEPGARSAAFSERAPARVAIKVLKPWTDHCLAQANLRSVDVARREIEALHLVRALRPPTAFIIGLYGSGTVEIQAFDDSPQVLPWIALELVEGGSAGATLAERVRRACDEGIDPARALRLARGMVEGAAVFHHFGVLHRDIKPENVFVTGPIGDETPKLADCGIARVEGITDGTLVGVTPDYAGPEQMLSALWPTERNPLVGPWSDVHALAATLWFVLGGEPWSRGGTAWGAGERRTLRSARRLHRGLLDAGPAFDAIDDALRRGASPKLPAQVWEQEGVARYAQAARRRFPALSSEEREARYAGVAELAGALLPPLEACAAAWVERRGRSRRA